MKLIVQPRDGLAPLIGSIRQAQKEVDVVIFRCDQKELQDALEAAVKRGVRVRALIAHQNKGGSKQLRKLEQDLLDAGVTVSRTGDEFVRYHGKMLTVDRGMLWVLGFNFTSLDIKKSRSFGVMTKRSAEVSEAIRLFEADLTRQPFAPGKSLLVVSPESARPDLMNFIKRAKQQLLIYDPKVSDPAFAEALEARQKAGVEIKIIGKVGGKASHMPCEKFPGRRLHVRLIIRDRAEAFLGSQSLRTLELDKRREIGLIVKEKSIVSEMIKVFEDDWAETASGKKEIKKEKKKREREHRRSAA